MKTWADSEKTNLFGGEATTKDSLRIDACGDVDELNSFLGLARARLDDKEVDAILRDVQRDLFIIGADLAKAGSREKAVLTKEHVKKLEDMVHKIEKDLPKLTKFILPSGTHAAALLHVSRSVCRRAERKCFALKKKEIVNEDIIKYLNRLSTLLFDLARLANKKAGVKEDEW
ncbi:MAG: cob(I)yrinic acid a,c-diamide adenosyltransferase [Candidatus Aenigmarchaeota archaeon]|nr:cob(I)yrinic acid a,c-diamide adenosyltransferase [Candidatus Aenigmarchaeota archaeon]